jgi:hypothetical protein
VPADAQSSGRWGAGGLKTSPRHPLAEAERSHVGPYLLVSSRHAALGHVLPTERQPSSCSRGWRSPVGE